MKSNNKKSPRFSPAFIGHLIRPLFCHVSLAKADEVQSEHLFILKIKIQIMSSTFYKIGRNFGFE